MKFKNRFDFLSPPSFQRLADGLNHWLLILTFVFAIGLMSVMPARAAGLPPVAISDTYRTGMNTTLVVTLENAMLENDFDPDDDIISVISFVPPSSGALSGFTANGTFNYIPASGFQGVVTFEYTISDDNSPDDDTTASASVTIVVGEDPNRPPTAVPDRYFIDENTTLTIIAPGVLNNDYDIDGDTISATQFIDAEHGDATFFTDGSFTYLPPTDFTGIDTFYYRIKDGDDTSISNYTTVTIVVGIPFGTELLTNGGFETQGTAAKDALGWTLIGTKKLGEKRLCNNPITQKFYAQQGQCAYRFIGQATDQATLEQKVAKPTVDALIGGDTLTLNAYIERTKIVGGGSIRVIVDYVNKNLPSTIKSRGIAVGDDDFEDYIVFSTPTLTLTNVPRRIRVRITYKGKSGSFLVDSVSLVKNGGAVPLANTVILPPPPDAIWEDAQPAP